MSSDKDLPGDDSEFDHLDQMVDKVENFDDFAKFLSEFMEVIEESDELFGTLLINYIAQMRSNITFAKAVAADNPEHTPAFPDQPEWSDFADLLLNAALEI